MKNCPFCSQEISENALVCKYCGKRLPPAKEKHPLTPRKVSRGTILISAGIGLYLLCIGAIVASLWVSKSWASSSAQSSAPARTASQSCDATTTMKIIKKIDEYEKTTVPSTPDQLTKLTRQQADTFRTMLAERITTLDHMDVPGCLQESVNRLKIIYLDQQELFNGDKKDAEIQEQLLLISAEQKAFTKKYRQIETCIIAKTNDCP